MRELLHGRVVLVTGGTQGVGRSVALAAARERASAVAVLGRDPAKAEGVLHELQELGAEPLFIRADLADPAQGEQAVATTIERFGRVDSLVNAAGLTTRGSITGTSHELLQAHLNVNFAAPFFTMARVIEDLVRRGEPGTIVNILSISAHAGQPYLAPYAAAKGALAVATRNAAFAHRFDRIRINGLNIGWTLTPGEDSIQRAAHGASAGWEREAAARLPLGKLGQPDEIADAVVFLLSDRSGVVTGSVIDWDQTVIGAYE